MDWLYRLSKEQKGVFIVFTAVLLPIIFACAGLAMDLGNIFAHQSKLQHAADAAALAGAAEFAKQSETIDKHPMADAMALGYANADYQKTISAGNRKMQAQTKDDKSYYRVKLIDDVPITFMRIMGFGPTQKVVVYAIALIPHKGSSDGSSTGSGSGLNLITTRDWVGGNLNSDNMNQIHSTYDGKVITSNQNYYNEHVNDDKFKFWKSDALNMNTSDANRQDPPLYNKLELSSNEAYDSFAQKQDQLVKSTFDNVKNTTACKSIIGDQNRNNLTIPSSEDSAAYDYYYVKTDAQNLDIQLKNLPGDTNQPVYFFVDGKYSQIQINLQDNITRPIVFCYLGKANIKHHEYWTESDSTVKIAGNGHVFNGTVYTPYAHTVLNFDGNGNVFNGAVYTTSLDLPSNHGQYAFKDYWFSNGGGSAGGSGSGGSGSSGGVSVPLKLVDGSGLTWAD